MNGYQPYSMPNYGTYQNSYFQQQQPMQPMQQPRFIPQPTSNIKYVNGLEGVKALILPPNHTELVLDSDAKCFYIKRTDMEGRPYIETHPYTDLDEPSRTSPPVNFVTIEQFEALKKEIEQLKSKFNTEVIPNE